MSVGVDPVTQVAGEVDRVSPVNARVRVLVQEHCHEFVADLGRMLCIVHPAELRRVNLVSLLFVASRLFGLFSGKQSLTLALLGPAISVETLSKEQHELEEHSIKLAVDALRTLPQVHGEYLVAREVILLLFVQPKIIL